MGLMMVCDICGNELASSSLSCPFCGSSVEGAERVPHKGFVRKTVNLEAGRPVVEIALKKMNEVIEDSIRNDVKVLTIIHGYGSSGKGGVIRSECRKVLEFLKSKGAISDYIAGEDFNRRSGPVRALLHRYPQLAADKHLNRGNRGISLVILSSGLLLLLNLLSTIRYYATLWS